MSTDWSHVIGYTTGTLDNDNLVVGIDATTPAARLLAVIPRQPDTDTVTGALVARDIDGDTLVQQPTLSAGPIVYKIAAGASTPEKVGTLNTGGRLYPFNQGWAEAVTDGARTKIVLRRHDLTSTAAFTVAASDRLTASDDDHTLCLAGEREDGTTVATIDLATHRETGHTTAPANASALACIDGQPLLGYVTRGTAIQVRPLTAGAAAVTFPSGDLGALVPDGHQALAVLAEPGETAIDLVDPAHHRVTKIAAVPGLGDVDDAFVSHGILVAIASTSAATVDLTTHAVQGFDLPATSSPQ